MNQLRKFLVSIDSKGKLRQVELEAHWDDEQHGFIINRITGMFGGKLTEQPAILVDKGKAKRTVSEQAALQFNSKLKEYKDKGYKEIPKDPDTYSESELFEIVGEVATNQSGVLKPMLAKQADKVTNQKIYDKTWYASRKIDGVRMLLYKNEKGEIHTASRGGEHYDYSTTHITEHPLIIALFNKYPQLILDGELYKHGKSLQQISGAARMEKNAYDMDWLQYYVYDIVEPTLEFKDRLKWLEVIQKELNLGEFDPDKEYAEGELQVQMVPQQPVKGWDNIKALHDKFVSEGWEGCVIRDPDKVYRPNGRTNDMIKIKEYLTSEFLVTGYEFGLRGVEDMVFILQTEDGIKFKGKPFGDLSQKQWYIDNFEKECLGKYAMVKYFCLSDAGTPLQPSVISIRIKQDMPLK